VVDYRSRIYKNYASCMQDADPVFDEAEAVRWGRTYDKFLRGWLPEKKGAGILDVACGGGKLLYFFKKQGYTKLQGVDISPEQVVLSKQVTENVTESNAIDYLKNTRETYDLIAGLDILEHFKKDEVLQFLDACYDALRPGGRLILQTPNAESPWGSHHRYNDFTHEVGFNSNALKRLLAIVGFSGITAREAGPVVHGVLSFVRYLIWKLIWVVLALWNLAETGSKGSGIYTRVFFITGRKDSRK
jgi:2-polyprenyl-3-methyl-5-hydroxy-6-metoxy-1,4-benzoquinol methylase